MSAWINTDERLPELVNDSRELNAKFEAKLKEAGIPFESVQVFGAIGVSVHVRCLGEKAAQKWSSLLAIVFRKEPKVVKSTWEAKHNKGTCLKPTMRHGYLIGLNVSYGIDLTSCTRVAAAAGEGGAA